jgi:dolichol-phosphate mannosyltransferase
MNKEISLDPSARDGHQYRTIRHARHSSPTGSARLRSTGRSDLHLARRDEACLDRVSFVVPAFNEAGGIADLVAEINDTGHALGIEFEIVVVNDGSSDGTASILERLQNAQPLLTVIHQDSNRGQSAALHRGIEAARSDWVVTLDGDGQNIPADATLLIETLERARNPAAIGMIVGRRRSRLDPWIKRISSRVANRVRSRLLGDGVSDTGCGLKLIRRELFLRFPGFDHMHRFLPALARMHRCDVIEVDVGHRPRRTGASHYGTFDRLAAGLFDLLGVLWLKRRTLASRSASATDR